MKHLHIAIQMVLVGVITTLIAYFLDLKYWYTSGVIAILSINMSKRETLKVALNRSFGVLIGLSLSTLLFVVLSYDVWVYLLFITIFIFILWFTHMPEGIVVSIVLVNHILLEGKFNLELLLNEFAIYGLALVIAISVHLIYPKVSEKKMTALLKKLDEAVADHLFALSLYLKDLEGSNVYKQHADYLKHGLKQAIKEAEMFEKDQIITKPFDYKAYLIMREKQVEIIDRMYDLTQRIKSKEPIMLDISNYISKLCFDIGIENKATIQKQTLHAFRQTLNESMLPKTRVEFESRAILYQMLYDIETFLTIKETYHGQERVI